MHEGMHHPLPYKGRPQISQEQSRYNTYVHRDLDIQCPTMQPHRTHEPKWLPEK